jgi:hypothetical protein
MVIFRDLSPLQNLQYVDLVSSGTTKPLFYRFLPWQWENT